MRMWQRWQLKLRDVLDKLNWRNRCNRRVTSQAVQRVRPIRNKKLIEGLFAISSQTCFLLSTLLRGTSTAENWRKLLKIPSRSVIHSTLFNCTEFGDSGESGEPGDSDLNDGNDENWWKKYVKLKNGDKQWKAMRNDEKQWKKDGTWWKTKKNNENDKNDENNENDENDKKQWKTMGKRWKMKKKQWKNN